MSIGVGAVGARADAASRCGSGYIIRCGSSRLGLCISDEKSLYDTIYIKSETGT
jgi:hypothetical protein